MTKPGWGGSTEEVTSSNDEKRPACKMHQQKFQAVTSHTKKAHFFLLSSSIPPRINENNTKTAIGNQVRLQLSKLDFFPKQTTFFNSLLLFTSFSVYLHRRFIIYTLVDPYQPWWFCIYPGGSLSTLVDLYQP